MFNIYYGNMKEAVYNTAAYFKYDYEDSWIFGRGKNSDSCKVR